MIIKSKCPRCKGDQQRLRTKVVQQQNGWFFGRTHCYKCGYHVPASLIVEKAARETFSLK